MSAIANVEQSFPNLPPVRDGLRLILETALDAVVIMNAGGVVIDWNDLATSTFGWSRDEAVGRTMADLIFLSDTVNRTGLDFDDISEAAKEKH